MRWSYVLCFFMAAFSVPAVAADADQNLKQEVEKIGAAYAESFNKQDGAGIAPLFATGCMHVNPAGPRTIAQFYEGAFKAGLDHEEITVDQVWPLGSDTLLAIGQSHHRQEPERVAHRDRGRLNINGRSRRRKMESQDVIGYVEAAAAASKVNETVIG